MERIRGRMEVSAGWSSALPYVTANATTRKSRATSTSTCVRTPIFPSSYTEKGTLSASGLGQKCAVGLRYDSAFTTGACTLPAAFHYTRPFAIPASASRYLLCSSAQGTKSGSNFCCRQVYRIVPVWSIRSSFSSTLPLPRLDVLR